MFLHNFKNKEDVLQDFYTPKGWENINIILASYTYENYSGNAFVLFEQNGKYYEVNGSHCSCRGLEECWSPEETSLEALTSRLVNGTLGRDYDGTNEFADELAMVLKIYEFNRDFEKKLGE